MQKILINRYKRGSKSARALYLELKRRGLPVVMPPRKTVRLKDVYGMLVINWGAKKFPDNNNWRLERRNVKNIYNSFEACYNASDKKLAFQKLSEGGISIPEWTFDKEVAKKWQGYGHTVVARKLTRANSGRGIIIVREGEEIPNAPLYTKYVKKRAEYRVHVFNTRVLDIQQKRKVVGLDEEIPNRNQIRNRKNGWVFCRENMEIADGGALTRLAINAVIALDIDFGAVDIIYNARENKYYVLEVNTAPGLEGTTLTNYGDAIQKYWNYIKTI